MGKAIMRMGKFIDEQGNKADAIGIGFMYLSVIFLGLYMANKEKITAVISGISFVILLFMVAIIHIYYEVLERRVKMESDRVKRRLRSVK